MIENHTSGEFAKSDEECMSADGTHIASSSIDSCPVGRVRDNYRFLNR